jgi:hypothetical protein
MPSRIRVVIGHEPRFYREALAEALRCLRPDLEVMLTEPAALEEVVQRGGASVVVCSRLSPVLMAHALAWVLLYPDGENRAVVSVGGEERTTPGFGIADLLALIAEAWALTGDSEGGAAAPGSPQFLS